MPEASKRILVTFGRSDPLHLTEATHALLGDTAHYYWGENFNRPEPEWSMRKPGWRLDIPRPLYEEFKHYDVVYCGHGATLLEATAAGCEVMVLTELLSIYPKESWTPVFIPAWTGPHLDHSGRIVEWWNFGVMARMAAEIRDRRKR